MGDVVGAWDVDRQEDYIVDVDIIQTTGVDWNVDNQLSSCFERNVFIKEDSWWYQRLIRCKQIKRIPIVIEKDGICQITYPLGENTPHVRTWLAAKTQTQPHEEDFGFGKHGAGLQCRRCVEMHELEGGFVINL